MHNIQSVRILMYLENNGDGSNITIQVLDGILCHNGEKLLNCYNYKKTKEVFLDKLKKCYKDKNYTNNLIPYTLEACVVRISDIIAYIGRDLIDAMEYGLINESDIPKEVCNILGNNNKEIINTIIMDIIENSYNKNYIKLSDEIYNTLNILIKFNYENIYYRANSKETIKNYEEMFKTVFEKCIYILENNLTKYNIYKNFLNKMNGDYKTNTNARIVIDYIAGMTDDYFINEYNKLKKI